MAEEIIVEVLNWEKFNPRSDRPGSQWLRLQHSLFDDPNFYSFTHSEICSWIYILCEASKGAKRGCARLNFERAKRVCGLTREQILSCIKKCQSRQILGKTVTPRGDHLVTSALPTGVLRNDTIRDDTNVNNLAQAGARASVSFDFESVYRDYPRKVGKARGLKICKAQIRTEEDFEALKLAVEHYLDYCTKNATEVRFIKHFSTFMGEWRDWLDPQTGTMVAKPKPPKPTERCDICNGAGMVFSVEDPMTAEPCQCTRRPRA